MLLKILIEIFLIGLICFSVPFYILAVVLSWVILGDEWEDWKQRRKERANKNASNAKEG